ncbi:MAG: hypothetical protein KDK64_06335 [Chlamydiia bacterium]|nr:hypothetical protein [Chlamydiia bacterium]
MDEKSEGFGTFYYFFFIIAVYLFTLLRNRMKKKKGAEQAAQRPMPPRRVAPPPSIPVTKKPVLLPRLKEAPRKVVRRRPRIVKLVQGLQSKKELILLSEILSLKSHFK